MYATRTRDHDALWYLQHTLVTTDMAVAKARGKRTIRSRGPLSATSPPDPDEAAAAVRAVHRIAAQMGLDDAARLEVLDALGLAEPPPPVEPWSPGIVVPARAAGTCRTCHRRGVYLRKDGTLSRHNRNPNLPASDSQCPGSLTLPRSEAKR